MIESDGHIAEMIQDYSISQTTLEEVFLNVRIPKIRTLHYHNDGDRKGREGGRLCMSADAMVLVMVTVLGPLFIHKTYIVWWVV